MPYLGDFLGQLLSEIAIARMQTDLETLRLAELYAGHPLLKTLPVPHLRLPAVDIDVPVLVATSEEPSADAPPRGGAPLNTLRETFDKTLFARLQQEGIAPTASERQKLTKALDERIERLARRPDAAVDVHRVADDLSMSALKVIDTFRRGAGMPRGVQALRAGLTADVRRAFEDVRRAPPRLVALVTTSEVRNAGAPEHVTRLHLKITEDGLEWTSVEAEGRVQDRLVPE